jgi:hypothetical protein
MAHFLLSASHDGALIAVAQGRQLHIADAR